MTLALASHPEVDGWDVDVIAEDRRSDHEREGIQSAWKFLDAHVRDPSCKAVASRYFYVLFMRDCLGRVWSPWPNPFELELHATVSA